MPGKSPKLKKNYEKELLNVFERCPKAALCCYQLHFNLSKNLQITDISGIILKAWKTIPSNCLNCYLNHRTRKTNGAKFQARASHKNTL